MQEIPAVKTTSSDILDQLRSAALVDTSSQSSAFADCLSIMSRPATTSAVTGSKADALDLVKDSATSQNSFAARQSAELQAQTQAQATSQTASQTATQTTAQTTTQATAQTTTAASAKTSAADASLDAARDLPVSREAWEELRPTLTSIGLTTKEVEDLSASAQAGQLTWGGLVQTVAGHMSGAKKPVELSASQRLDLQSLFQKLGFSPDSAKGLVSDVAKGDGVKVLAKIQQKLATMPADQSLGLSSGEMSTLFKSLNLPEATANKLAELFNSDTTVAGLQNGLNLAGQELLLQRAQSESLEKDQLRTLAKVMKKDVDKARRESGLATSTSTSATQSADAEPRHQRQQRGQGRGLRPAAHPGLDQGPGSQRHQVVRQARPAEAHRQRGRLLARVFVPREERHPHGTGQLQQPERQGFPRRPGGQGRTPVRRAAGQDRNPGRARRSPGR